MPETIGLIPLRGGSKRIPQKNIKEIAGRPLAYWVCRAASEARSIEEVYVSTEDQRIREVVESFGLGIRVIERPVELAGDRVTTDEVMTDFMQKVPFSRLVTIQATSPLLTPTELDAALEQFSRGSYDSMLSGVVVKRFFWSPEGVPLNYDFLSRPFTQDFGGSVMENGAFYITKREILKSYHNRLGGKIGAFLMPDRTAVELDNPVDWAQVEALLLRGETAFRDKIREVRIILSDFDGTWTDNKVCSDSSGSEVVRCSKEDSLGLNEFRKFSTIPLLVVSKERNEAVRRRCDKLGLPLLDCVDEKFDTISEELARHKMSWAQACYVGNDVNDLRCMTEAVLSFCPCDARPEIKSTATYILSRAGGNGAIREMLELFRAFGVESSNQNDSA